MIGDIRNKKAQVLISRL